MSKKLKKRKEGLTPSQRRCCAHTRRRGTALARLRTQYDLVFKVTRDANKCRFCFLFLREYDDEPNQIPGEVEECVPKFRLTRVEEGVVVVRGDRERHWSDGGRGIT